MLLIDALKLAGYGRFHMLYYSVTIILLIICGAHINLNIFINFDPLHRCKVPEDANWTELQMVAPPSSQIIPGKTIYSACTIYNWTRTWNNSILVNRSAPTSVCPYPLQYLEGIGYGGTTLTGDATDATFGPTAMQDVNYVNLFYCIPVIVDYHCGSLQMSSFS